MNCSPFCRASARSRTSPAPDDFIADGLLDSFDVVTLVATLDRTYGISIDGVEIVPEHFRNIESITALLGRYGVRV